MWKIYSDLTKFGIVVFVLFSGLAGYATSFQIESQFSWEHLTTFLIGLYFLSSGSLALNQVQEYEIDQRMQRTAHRPIASGKLKPAAGWILSVIFLFIGANYLFLTSATAGLLGLLSVVLYNFFYTKFWKPRWVFGAVPGAIPGALPVTIGYAANDARIFSLDSVYLFLIMFLWQMPHFWALALKYKEDYAKGGFPLLPVRLGVDKTIYHIGLYTFAYVIVAVASPWFVHANWTYLLVVVPFALKVLWEFLKFQKSHGQSHWLPFFLWTNFSMLVFLLVPIIDKWNFIFSFF